jgi:hypothetical protein
MWDSETERLEKKACTSVGFSLHVVSELIGFVGLLMLPASGVVFVWKMVVGSPKGPAGWLLAAAFGLGAVSEVMFQYSWQMARRRGFEYDGKVASWVEKGERRTYRFTG